MKMIPKTHQLDATTETTEVFASEDRTNIIMPCGTGKTMIGSMVAEALKANTVVLLFPSIALIRQTLGFWKETGNLDGRDCLCVCSDKTVAVDDVEINEDELGMHITTSSDEVTRFFANSTDKVTVFSTYQSAHVLASGMPNSFSFDLGIFDESHRTAAGDENMFSFALSNDNFKITKRLFMTATPKHFADDEGQAKTYSMDNEAIYGKSAYVLPIREAIKAGLISDYKVLVSAVTKSDLTVELEKNKNNKNSLADLKMMATAIAIRKAIDTTGVKKIITFHNTVMAAKRFAESNAVKKTLKTKLLHVSGKMKSKQRSQVMNDFANTHESLVTNARCLTEGVDSPGVDMVVFVDAKESTTDIVQAVGRAMRITDDKNVGYILLPVFIDIDKYEGDIEAALKASGMSTIWDVLSNMSEQESMIAYKSSSKAELREARKKRIKFEVVSSDPVIAEKLHESIDVYYAYRNASIFDDNYKKLVEFQAKHGHCNPSLEESEELNVWLRRVRFSHKQNKLSQFNIERLEAIGFAWDGRDPAWEANFQAFLKGEETIKWRSVQRAFYRQGKLKPEREKRLRDSGFMFEADSTNRHKQVVPEKNLEEIIEETMQDNVLYNVVNSNLNCDTQFLDDNELMEWNDYLKTLEYDEAIVPMIVTESAKFPLAFIQDEHGSLLMNGLERLMHASTHRNNDALNSLVLSDCAKIRSPIHMKAFHFMTGINISNGMGELAYYLESIVSKSKVYKQIEALPCIDNNGLLIRSIETFHPVQVKLMGLWIYANIEVTKWLYPNEPFGLEYIEKTEQLSLNRVHVWRNTWFNITPVNKLAA